jgi:hypothetical protein
MGGISRIVYGAGSPCFLRITTPTRAARSGEAKFLQSFHYALPMLIVLLASSAIKHPAGYLWQPVIESSEDRHHVGPDQNVMDVSSGLAARFSPGEKHWHGATPSTGMTHIAIQEKKDGKVVDWMEHVSDEQYRK